ncbi:hypothetical protein ACXYMO_00285 [Arenibacterium sp. CAU 1754]
MKKYELITLLTSNAGNVRLVSGMQQQYNRLREVSQIGTARRPSNRIDLHTMLEFKSVSQEARVG